MELAEVVNCFDPGTLLPMVVSMEMDFYRQTATEKQMDTARRAVTAGGKSGGTGTSG